MTSIKILGFSHRFLYLAFGRWCGWGTKQTMCCMALGSQKLQKSGEEATPIYGLFLFQKYV